MRIAICLSGQPRMWRACLPFWQSMFADHGEVQFDTFFHFWNFNTPSATHNDTLSVKPQPQLLPQSELDDIVALLEPRAHAFAGPEIDPPALLMDMTRRRTLPWPHNSDLSDPLVYRLSSQFYSLMQVANLKRTYELDHGFEYDICVRARADLVFPPMPMRNELNRMPLPRTNTVYAVHTAYEERFQEFRLGDLFFYADSPTFDRLALFFKGLSLMTESMFGGGVYPEIALMLHAKALNIEVEPIPVSPKVRRDPVEYAGRKLGSVDIV